MKLSLTAILLAALVGVSSAAEEHTLRRSLQNGNGNGNNGNGNNGNGNGNGNGDNAPDEEEGDFDGVDPQTVEDSRAEDVALIAALNNWGI